MDTTHEGPDEVFGCLFKGLVLLVLLSFAAIFGLGVLVALLITGNLI